MAADDCMAMPRQLAFSRGQEPEKILANSNENEKLVQHKKDVDIDGSKRIEAVKVVKTAKAVPKAVDLQKERPTGREAKQLEHEKGKMTSKVRVTTPEKPSRQKRRTNNNQPRNIERSRNVQGGILRAFLRQCAKEIHRCSKDSEKNDSKIRNIVQKNDKIRYLQKKQSDQLQLILKEQKRIRKRIRKLHRCIFNYE